MITLLKKRGDEKSQNQPTAPAKRYLPALSVYGFDTAETAILASLVTEDPPVADRALRYGQDLPSELAVGGAGA